MQRIYCYSRSVLILLLGMIGTALILRSFRNPLALCLVHAKLNCPCILFRLNLFWKMV